jgi:hypothetical protein
MRRLIMATVLMIMCLFAAPISASAFNPFGGVDCTNGAAAGSATCSSQTSSDPVGGDNGLLAKITNIIAFVGGAAAIIVILVSALRFITSGSDISTGSRTDTDVENARRSLGGALIGLAVIVLARALILFVLEKL